MNESAGDLIDAAKLRFGLSTGAVVLFAHATSEFHHMPVRTGILTIAVLFFGFSAIHCIEALVHMARIKTAIGDVLWREEEKRGDLLLEKAKLDIAGALTRFEKMDRYFYAGIMWSVVFMIVQFAASFRN